MAQPQTNTVPSTTEPATSTKKPHFSVALIDESKDPKKNEFWDFVGVAYRNGETLKVILNRDVPKGSTASVLPTLGFRCRHNIHYRTAEVGRQMIWYWPQFTPSSRRSRLKPWILAPPAWPVSGPRPIGLWAARLVLQVPAYICRINSCSAT